MKTPKKPFGSMLIILIVVFAQFALPSPVYAASITVNTLVDEDTNNASCSLREAIIAANNNAAYNGCSAGAGPDIITFSIAGTITLGSELPAITSDMSIDGGGVITLSGNNVVRILMVQSPASLSLSELTLADGNSGAAQGGAMYINSSSTVAITDSTFISNTSAFNSAAVAIPGGAGAIYNAGTLSITGSTFSGNTATGPGGDAGAIMSVGAIDISNSTFYNNSAVTDSSGGTGGAIRLEGGAGPNTLIHLTLSENANDAPFGALDINNTSATLELSILANSTTGLDCSKRNGGILTSTNNLIETDSPTIPCSFAVTGDPSLDPGGLQDNGGPTQTLALMPGSIAIDALADSLVVCGAANDQRGVIRPLDGNGNGTASCDLGAYEVQGSTTTTITQDNPDPSVVGQAVTVNFTVTSASGTPTGNVTVTDSASAASCTSTVAVGTCNIIFNTLGARTLTATYAGDTNFTGSTSAGEAHTVNLAPTTVTITSDAPDPSVVGQAVNVIVTVSGGAATPTGTVDITGADTNCTITLAGGTGNCDVNFASVGAKTLIATYNGDVSHATSNDTEAHTVDLAATTTTITTDNPDPSLVGQLVTVNFTVTAASGTPTGNVTVTDSVSAASCTATVAVGTCNITLNTTGARTLTATYAGDANFASSSDTEAHSVNVAPVFTSANTATFTVGTAGLFSITTTGTPTPTISHMAGALPTGVSFTDNGDGTATLGGTPAAGTANLYTLTFVASNGVNPDASQTFTLTVNETPTITSANNTAFTVGSLGSFTVTTSGSPTITTITLGGDPLPANVVFADNGNGTATLSGIPQAGTDGTYNLSFTASNGVGTPATQNFTLTVNLPTPPKVAVNGIGSIPDSGDGYIAEAEIVTIGITSISVTFDQEVRNAGASDPDSVTNPANYILVRDNGDGIQTTTCAIGGGVIGGDLAITINTVTYSNGGGSGPFVATLNLNGGIPLVEGAYRLIVCGTTSIISPFGIALAGDGVNPNTDFTRNFVIAFATSEGGRTVEAKTLPTTGFPMGAITDLPSQPAHKAYTAYGDFWLEVPKLGLKMSIVGVPQSGDTWDVTWLGADAGYLQGTAFPTWKGNTVLTAHVWDANNNPGPFAKIKNLLYGDQVKIHAFGQVYTYEVRDSRLVSPSNSRSVLKHEELDWITLLTCEDYKVLFKNYTYRRAVRAVLINVTAEK